MKNGAVETTTAIEAHIPSLRRFARALMRGDPARADDLVQDSLLRALIHLKKRQPDRDLRGWLFTILYNCFCTQKRRRQREGVHYSLECIAETDLPGLVAAQESAVAHRDLLRAFAELTDEQQAVMLLVVLEDLSYDEVSRVLGIPIGTVMSRLSRGRERLRRYMNEGVANSERCPLARANWPRGESGARSTAGTWGRDDDDPQPHMLDDQPQLYFMHFRANHDAVKRAKGPKPALAQSNIGES
jgi:RNA polymerase sigma-70 factor, ECF subfamily